MGEGKGEKERWKGGRKEEKEGGEAEENAEENVD